MRGAKLVVQSVTVYQLAIPLRRRVRHSVTTRRVSEPIIVAVELQNGTVGFGETLPREYVTGETNETVVATLRRTLVPVLVDFRAPTFSEALEAIESLPWHDGTGQRIPAARAAVEMALLDAVLKFFGRGLDDVVGWMGLIGFGWPGSVNQARFSAIVTSEDLVSTRRLLGRYRLAGFADYKVKVGDDEDMTRVRWAATHLRRGLQRGRRSLRVDANAAWTLDEALDWVSAVRDLPLCAMEQPLRPCDDVEVHKLRKAFDGLIVADESLQTLQDAQRLVEQEAADVFNIRLSKCGGMLPSLRLAAFARKHGLQFQLGCMVGETSILAASGLSFMSAVPGVRWAEGCFGTRLLEGDVVARSLLFGYAGRWPGGRDRRIDVEAQALERYALVPPVVTAL